MICLIFVFIKLTHLNDKLKEEKKPNKKWVSWRKRMHSCLGPWVWFVSSWNWIDLISRKINSFSLQPIELFVWQLGNSVHKIVIDIPLLSALLFSLPYFFLTNWIMFYAFLLWFFRYCVYLQQPFSSLLMPNEQQWSKTKTTNFSLLLMCSGFSLKS